MLGTLVGVSTGGVGRRASCSVWRSRWRAPSSCCGSWRDNGDLHTRAGHIAVGWLVVEDLFTVLVLVLLPAIFAPGNGGAGGIAIAILVAVVKLAAMVGLTFVVGKRVIPWLLDRGRDSLSRAVHPDAARTGAWASPWGPPSSSAYRWPSVPFSPAWSSVGRNSACGRQPKHCRCETHSPCCSSSRSACSSIRDRWSNPRVAHGSHLGRHSAG